MTAAYLDKYFECVEFMPLELQRCVSQLKEVDVHTKGLYEKVEGLRCDLVKAVQEGNVPQQKICFRRLQESMLEAREAGNAKLEISSQLLDIAEGCGQLLDLRSKDAENHKNEDFHHNSRYSNPTGNYRSKTESPSLFLPNGGHEPKPAKRSSSNKRPRQTATASVDKSVEDVVQEKASSKEGGRGRENSVGSVSSVGTNGGSLNQSSNSVSGGGGGGGGGGAGGGKPPKKKIKTVKKKAVTTKEKEAPPTITSTGQVPMPRPDLTSQPLDPDEPTYCLCQQVSFGEMIGCDNEDCPIEWFHFQCVKLTSKPKGKWYCPRCTQERKRTSK